MLFSKIFKILKDNGLSTEEITEVFQTLYEDDLRAFQLFTDDGTPDSKAYMSKHLTGILRDLNKKLEKPDLSYDDLLHKDNSFLDIDDIVYFKKKKREEVSLCHFAATQNLLCGVMDDELDWSTHPSRNNSKMDCSNEELNKKLTNV